MKKNSFRCFAIFQSGVGNSHGEFLLKHQRGCKKTFCLTEQQFRRELTEYNYESNNQFASDRFKLNNWYAIRDVKNRYEGIWFAMLCFPDCDQSKVYEALDKLSTYYTKREEYFTLQHQVLYQIYNVESIVQEVEKYIYLKQDDGYMTEEESIGSAQWVQRPPPIQNESVIISISNTQVNNNLSQSIKSYCDTINQTANKQLTPIINPCLQRSLEEGQIVMNINPLEVPPFQPTSPIIPIPNPGRQKCIFDPQDAQRQMLASRQQKQTESQSQCWRSVLFC